MCFVNWNISFFYTLCQFETDAPPPNLSETVYICLQYQDKASNLYILSLSIYIMSNGSITFLAHIEWDITSMRSLLFHQNLSNGSVEAWGGLTELLARSLSQFLGRTEDAIQWRHACIIYLWRNVISESEKIAWLIFLFFLLTSANKLTKLFLRFGWLRMSSSECYQHSQLLVYPTSEIYLKMCYSDHMYVAFTYELFTF